MIYIYIYKRVATTSPYVTPQRLVQIVHGSGKGTIGHVYKDGQVSDNCFFFLTTWIKM